MNPHKRQQRQAEREKRQYHKDMRELQSRCNDLDIDTYIAGEDDDIMIVNPNYYICILSHVDTDLLSCYYPGMTPEAICVTIYDYDLFKDILLEKQ